MVNLSRCAWLVSLLLFISFGLVAQKKMLDHSVYDAWESIGEKKISDNGEWICYTIDVQEGDSRLILQRSDSSFIIEIPRGYASTFSVGSLFLIFKIKPFYAEVRNAKINKKKDEYIPKDSLGIFDLLSRSLEKVPQVISYHLPEKSGEWLAYQIAKIPVDSSKKNLSVDTAKLKSDTITNIRTVILEHVPNTKQKRKLTSKEKDNLAPIDEIEKDGAMVDEDAIQGSRLVIQQLTATRKIMLDSVSQYLWSENGKLLLVGSAELASAKNGKSLIYLWRSRENRFDTLLNGANSFSNFSIDKNAYQLAFLAEVDSSFKSTQKFYKLFYWKNGDRAASVLVDRFSKGMPINWTVNPNYQPYFSKTGNRLFLGTSPVKPIKDTALVDIDLVKLDIWHYNDDFIQPTQLKSLDKDNKKSYLAMMDLGTRKFIQLADLDLASVVSSNDGDGTQFLGVSDKGNRKEMQWNGFTSKDVYAVSPVDGSRTLLIKDLQGTPQISSFAKYIYWYDMNTRKYVVHHAGMNINISKGVPVSLSDEEHDMPSSPSPYGVVQWHDQDSAVYIYDRYDIWKLDPEAHRKPINITLSKGRASRIVYRYVLTNPDERYFSTGQPLLLKTFNESNKHAGLAKLNLSEGATPIPIQSGPFSLGSIVKSTHSQSYMYTKESDKESPNVFFSNGLYGERKMSKTNPNQTLYNWLSAELFSWKAYDGKMASGIVYKPENFQEGRKYPMITYIYEKLSARRYNYLPPSPASGSLNIPFFVSRGYIVFLPDIHYKIGHPGQGAYDHVVSGVRAIIKKGWVDSLKLGIQGQSWGGYQVAHIITRTNIFSAAWASTPVVNMFSAYGGIRWETGMNRQFQYEKGQSRIGATIWQKPELYIENSPLFHLPKIQTPLAIMANDNDGAVPWYQGIELFTAMRRLNKKVWMLNYNGEAHGLIERKNRKDLQIRQQQFFDWLLKGEKPSLWLSTGVSAIEKGGNWGLEFVN
jgi:dienelactone hydrolase